MQCICRAYDAEAIQIWGANAQTNFGNPEAALAGLQQQQQQQQGLPQAQHGDAGIGAGQQFQPQQQHAQQQHLPDQAGPSGAGAMAGMHDNNMQGGWSLHFHCSL